MDEDIAKPEVYQFRIALREISPSIWRRVVKNIATGFIESTVNQVVSKRFLKHQSMQWTERCTHLLLQARTKTLNDELRHTFENWYPGMKATA